MALKYITSLNLAFQMEQSEIVICPEDICECQFLIWKTMENKFKDHFNRDKPRDNMV